MSAAGIGDLDAEILGDAVLAPLRSLPGLRSRSARWPSLPGKGPRDAEPMPLGRAGNERNSVLERLGRGRLALLMAIFIALALLAWLPEGGHVESAWIMLREGTLPGNAIWLRHQ